jgi:hypothetical protein
LPSNCTLKHLVSEFINSAAVVSVRTSGRSRHTAFPTTFNGEGTPYDGNGSRPSRNSSQPSNSQADSRKRTNSKADQQKKRKDILDNIRRKVRENSTHHATASSSQSDPSHLNAGDQLSDTEARHTGLVTTSHTALGTTRRNPPFPLAHSWTLDCGSDVHVCNNPLEFTWERPAYDESIGSGDSTSPIVAWGKMRNLPSNSIWAQARHPTQCGLSTHLYHITCLTLPAPRR